MGRPEGQRPRSRSNTPGPARQATGRLADERNGLVLIDTPREANNAGYIAAQAADFIMIPFKRGGFDFRALKRTLDLCRIANKRPCLLLNGMRVGATRQEADAREALAAYECDVAPVVFHDRPLYITASITTKTAQETDPASDAAAEIEALFLWIAGQVHLSTTRQRDKVAIA